MKYVNFYNLKPGDKIVVPKSWMQVIQHHVIYLGQNHLGVHLIAENAVGSYVRVIAVDQFFQENPRVTRIDRFSGNNVQRRLAIERALKKLGQPYDLINFNCEHFANYVQKGVLKSDQVGWGILLLGVLAIAAFAD
ncbi:MAG TPA: lecithin retinol acyltransferase family protein [Chryseolinea sp.]|nr:lecithin retinol acyltransferase family protein [Chryseolinea sp.]